MLNRYATLAFTLAALLCTLPASAQAPPTATALSNLQVGAGYSYGRTDFGQKGVHGFSAFADYDLGVHWGGEADYHYMSIVTPNNVEENSAFIGPRFIVRGGPWKLYAKGLIGAGRLTIPSGAKQTSFAYSLGGGVEYLASRHLTLRVGDFEYQRWSYRNGLTPVVLTFGAAYRFH